MQDDTETLAALTKAQREAERRRQQFQRAAEELARHGRAILQAKEPTDER
jgi:flagellin-like hook-associated protein FlgL